MKGRVAVLGKAKERFSIEEHDVPAPSPGTILVKQELAGICGTDVHIWEGFLREVPFPVVLGHENVGTIAELGQGVEADFVGEPVRQGDRVFPFPGLPCWHCYQCVIDKEPTRCAKGESYGFFPYKEPYFTGGYADYLYMFHPSSLFVKTDLKPEETVLIEPLAIAVRSVERGGVQSGDTAVIQGAGPIGLLTLACVIAAGATKAIVVGTPADRLKIAQEIGADLTIDIQEVRDVETRIRLVKEQTQGNRGPDVVFEDTGNPRAISEGLSYLKDNGRYLVAGCFTDKGPVEINPARMITMKQTAITGTWGDEPKDFLRAIRMLEKSKFHFEKLVSHKIPLRRVHEAFEAISSEKYSLDGKEIFKVAIDLRS